MRVQPHLPSRPLVATVMSSTGFAAWACSAANSPAPPDPRIRMSVCIRSSVTDEPPAWQYYPAQPRSAPSPLVGEGWGGGCLELRTLLPPSRLARFAREPTSPTRGEVSGASCEALASH